MGIYSENGWILPDGKYINCEHEGHIRCAKEELGMEESQLEKIAVKVSCLPVSIQVTIFGKDEYRPNFLTERRRMTKRQLETIEKYCVEFGYRPPTDYFIQQDLYDMANMSLDDILFILSKK